MNDTNEGIPMGNAEWQEIVKSIPVVCDITETTAEGVIRQVLKAVFEKNGLPMDKLDAMVSAVIAHSLDDISFAAMHGLAIPPGYISGLEKMRVGIGEGRLERGRRRVNHLALPVHFLQPEERVFKSRRVYPGHTLVEFDRVQGDESVVAEFVVRRERVVVAVRQNAVPARLICVLELLHGQLAVRISRVAVEVRLVKAPLARKKINCFHQK